MAMVMIDPNDYATLGIVAVAIIVAITHWINYGPI
jgi:hypothetical protein